MAERKVAARLWVTTVTLALIGLMHAPVDAQRNHEQTAKTTRTAAIGETEDAAKAAVTGRRLTRGTQGTLVKSFDALCRARRAALLMCEFGLVLTDYHRFLVLRDVCANDKTVAGCADFLKDPILPRVLRFSHLTQRWSGTDALPNDDPDLDFKGPMRVPLVYLGKGESLTIEVHDINPALYGVELGKATEADIEQLAELKALLPLVGGTVTSFFTATNALNLTRDPNRVNLFAMDDANKAQLSRTLGVGTDDATAVLTALNSLQGQILALQTQVDALRKALDVHEPKVLAVMGITQSLEREPALFPRAILPVATPEEWRALFGELRAKHNALEEGPIRCEGLLEGFSKVVAAEGVDKLQPALADFDAVPQDLCSAGIPGLAEALGNETRSLRMRAQEVRSAAIELARLDAIANGLKETGDANAEKEARRRLGLHRIEAAKKVAALAQEQEALRAKAGDYLTLHRTVALAKDVKAKAAKMLETENDGVLAVGNLRLVVTRLLVASDAKDMVQRHVIYSSDSFDGDWDKVRTQPLAIQRSSPYSAKIATAQPEKVETEYRLARRHARLWGIGVSLTQSSLRSPTFAAVRDPDAPDDEKRKIIGRSSETRKTGVPALLFNYRVGELLWPSLSRSVVRPGIELGVSLDTDDPGVFSGLSLEIAKYFRVGVGYAWQQINELDPNTPAGERQQEGLRVSNTDDIRTGERFRGKVYWSFTFALDSIPLFSRE